MAMICSAWGKEEAAAKTAEGKRVVDTKAMLAELIATTLFVIVGCGVACGHGASDGETRLVVAFAFGMAILVLAYAAGPHSGGQINPAVTFSLVLGRQLPWQQGVANLLAQLFGSVLGAGFLAALFPCGQDLTGGLGTNVINPAYGEGRALIGEVAGTFLLCYVVWETAVSPASQCGQNAPIAIGFAVFLAHLVLLPVDGCSINPTRSFGPAVVAAAKSCGGWTDAGLQDLWVMWVGPLLGAVLAAGTRQPFAPLRQPPPAAAKPTILGEGPEDMKPEMSGKNRRGTSLELDEEKMMPSISAQNRRGTSLELGEEEDVQGGNIHL